MCDILGLVPMMMQTHNYLVLVAWRRQRAPSPGALAVQPAGPWLTSCCQCTQNRPPQHQNLNMICERTLVSMDAIAATERAQACDIACA